MEIKEIPIPTMPDWLKLYNTYDPEYYAPGKRVSAEEWNTLFLASVRQGNYNADTLELLIKTYLPETYATQTAFNTFSNEMRAEYAGFTNNIQEDFIEHKEQVQNKYAALTAYVKKQHDTFTEQVQNQYDTFVEHAQDQYDSFTEQVQEDFTGLTNEVNSLEERVIKAEDVAYSLDDTIQEANHYAKQAFTVAESANNAAQEAAISAENAESSASNAQTISEEANSFAQTALTTSQNASTTSNEAKAQATHATDTANAALLRSGDAIATANAAKVESASAKTTAEQAEEVSTESNNIAQTANTVAAEARRIAQDALDQITEGMGSQVLVNGESVATFNADTKADLDYVDRQVAALIGAAPETLDTLEEVAAAFEENKEVVDALNAAIGTKANKADIEPTIQFAESERQKSKNLFNINGGSNYKSSNQTRYLINGETLSTDNDYTLLSPSGFKLNTVPNTNYTVSFNVAYQNYCRVYIYGISNNAHTDIKIASGLSHGFNSFKFNSGNYDFTVIGFSSALGETATFDSIQVEEGNVATEYQPYNGPILHEEDIKDLKAIRTLPYEYQEVEYIESTGTQYIDTGVIPSDKTQVDIEFEISSKSEADAALFGSRDGVGSSSSFVIWANNYGGNTNSTFTYSSYSSRKNLLLDTKYACKYSSAGMFVNGEEIGNPPSSDIAFTCQSVAILLGVRTGNTLDNRKFIGKVYSAKIFDRLTLVRDFIPCYRKADGEIGLYDLVNNVFYTNQGTGAFLKGKEIYLSNVARRNDASIKFAERECKKSKNLLRIVQDYTRTATIAEGTLTINKDTQTITINGPIGTGGWLSDINVVDPIICKANTLYTVSVHNVPTGSITGTNYKQFYLHFDSDKPWQNIDISNGSYKTFMFTEDTLLDGLTLDLNRENTYTNVSFNVQLEEGPDVSSWQYPMGPILHKVDLNDRVAFTKYAGISVAGTTKDVYKYDPTTIYAPNGLIMGGTALAAGLVTRGICGVNTPNEAGYCTKDNLYINYDGSNTYSSTRQLILQAENSGTHYGNNLYQYAAARGDAVKNYADANYLSLNSGGKLKGKLSFDGDNSITPLQSISYIVGLQPFASGGNLVYMNADKFKRQISNNIVPGGLNYFTTGYITSAAPASGITTSVSSNILTVTATEGNGNYISVSIDNDIEANMAEGEQFIFSMDIRATTDTSIAVSGKPKIYFKEGMGYYDMEGEVKRLSSGQYTTLTYVGNWKKAKADGTLINPSFHLGFGSAVGKFYITNLRFEKGNTRTELARLLSVDSTKIITRKSLSVPSGQTLTVAGVLNASSAGSFNYSGIETGGTTSNNMLRCVWFSHSSEKGRPIIAEDFKYNPYSKLLKVNGTVECSTINLLV